MDGSPLTRPSFGGASSVDVAAQLRQAIQARSAAASTTGIVMISDALVGTITGNDGIAWVIFSGIGGLGIGWFLWLHDRVEKLRAATPAASGAPNRAAQPSALAPSTATDPMVVVAVIGLVGTALTGVMALMK